MKTNKWDSVFSKIVRTRDRWSCVRCGASYIPPTKALHNSHYFSRTSYSTRFDEENCDALCYGCHQHWGSSDKEGYRAFKIKQLGENGFNALQVRNSQIVKRSDYLNDLIYKAFQIRLKELENEEFSR